VIIHTLFFEQGSSKIFIVTHPAHPVKYKRELKGFYSQNNDITPRKGSRHKNRRQSRQHLNQPGHFQSGYPIQGPHNAMSASVKDQAKSEPKPTREKY